ncbi:MAG: hypothetical protein WCG25_00360 [bacterium]
MVNHREFEIFSIWIFNQVSSKISLASASCIFSHRFILHHGISKSFGLTSS